MFLRTDSPFIPVSKQAGGMTVFTAVMVLIVLTLMIFYATRVGMFEQKVSANEVRQKAAFHAAESAIEQGIEYLLSNAQVMISSATDAFADGAGGTTRDGWFASNRWAPCTSELIADATHPCGGDEPMNENSFFYDDPDTISGIDSLPVGMTGFAADVTARLSVNMCFVNLSSPGTCGVVPGDAEAENEAFMILTMLGYGFADCANVNNVSTCTAEATIAKPVANFKNLSGAPVVPLTTKSTFPPSGTAELVPNPNAGGIGVPLSVWANNNSSCADDVAVFGSGSWATCERHEWYGVDDVPADVACDQPNCGCTQDESISYSDGHTTYQGIDISADPAFPCDLFEFYFGVPKSQYTIVKNTATVLDDCSSLDSSSTGVYWISGESCMIGSNAVIGSVDAPIILISAASSTQRAARSRPSWRGAMLTDGVPRNADSTIPLEELPTRTLA